MTLVMLKAAIDEQIGAGEQNIELFLTLLEAQAISNEIANLEPKPE